MMTTAVSKFSDEKFLSAIEKKRILAAWNRFLATGFKRGNFTDALYKHLHLHCGYIAHYNRNGFYDTYFLQAEKTMRFLKGVENSITYACVGEDLTSAMITSIAYYKPVKFLQQKNIEQKEVILETAKKELEKAMEAN